MRNVLAALMLVLLALAGCEEPAPGNGNGDGNGEGPDPLRFAYWPFLDVTYPAGQQFSLFVQWTGDLPPPVVPFGFEWITDSNRSGFYSGFFDSETKSIGNLTMTRMPDADDPRFGRDGHNATRVDFYVFVDSDELIGYTESISIQEIGRAPWRTDEPFTFPDEVYYLGDDESAPEGTEPLPFFLEPYKQQIRDLLEGLPEGGAASIIVPEEELGAAGAFLPGGPSDLYITGQVTELVHAP